MSPIKLSAYCDLQSTIFFLSRSTVNGTVMYKLGSSFWPCYRQFYKLVSDWALEELNSIFNWDMLRNILTYNVSRSSWVYPFTSEICHMVCPIHTELVFTVTRKLVLAREYTMCRSTAGSACTPHFYCDVPSVLSEQASYSYTSKLPHQCRENEWKLDLRHAPTRLHILFASPRPSRTCTMTVSFSALLGRQE